MEDEIYITLALLVLMCIIQKTSFYFSHNQLVGTPYLALLFLGINLNQFEKLFKISPILEHLNFKFKILCLPHQNISIDKSVALCNGHLSFM
jgi:hypothetical protein